VCALPNTSPLYGTAAHIPKADVENSLTGTHFAIVTTEDPPFITVRDGPDMPIKPWQEWSGWIPEMIKETSKMSGFTYTLQLSSNKNTYAYGASDREVVFNKTRTNDTTSTFPVAEHGGFGVSPPDMHWAGAYITSKRRDALDMATPFFTAPLSLVVLQQEQTIWGQAGSFLQPFNAKLWALILGMAFFAGFVYMALEETAENGGRFEGAAFKTQRSFWYSYADSMYMSGVSMATQLESFDPTNALGKIFVLMWSFWCLLVITAYTANLAAYMIATKPILTPSSLAEFIEPSSPYKACVLENSAYAAFLKGSPKYGSIKQVPKPGLFKMAEALVAGDCHGIIEREIHLQYLESLGGTQGYPVQVVDSLKDGPMHLSVMLSDRNEHVRNNEATRKLSYWITDLVGSGVVAEIYQYEVLRLQTINKISMVSEAAEFGLKDFLGVIIMYLSCIVPVFFFRVVKVGNRYLKYHKETKRKQRWVKIRNKIARNKIDPLIRPAELFLFRAGSSRSK